MNQPVKNKLSQLALTRMWGSTTKIAFDPTGAQQSQPKQVADVRLPMACACTVFFMAEVTSQPTVAGVVNSLELEMTIGLGRVTTTRKLAFAGVPNPGAQFEVTLPFVPLATLMATLTGTGTSFTPGSDYEITITMMVTPIGILKIEAEPLEFGMSTPGEAEDLDESLRDELEPDAPSPEEVAEEFPDDMPADATDPEEAHEVEVYVPRRRRQIVIPPELERYVERLSRRLGRPARLGDLDPQRRQLVLDSQEEA